jgi:hypothetical protein
VAGLFTGLGFGMGSSVSIGLGRGLAVGVACAAVTVAAGAVATSQAVALQITTFWLAISGTAPFTPMSSLGYAHEKQLLRQFGTRYQFRHDAVREYFELRE